MKEAPHLLIQYFSFDPLVTSGGGSTAFARDKDLHGHFPACQQGATRGCFWLIGTGLLFLSLSLPRDRVRGVKKAPLTRVTSTFPGRTYFLSARCFEWWHPSPGHRWRVANAISAGSRQESEAKRVGPPAKPLTHLFPS